jgi:hypothetical protein
VRRTLALPSLEPEVLSLVEAGKMCALRVSRLHTRFHYFLLELEALAHRLMIVISGNDAPKIIPDKSLGSGLVFRMAVTVNLWT